MNHIDSDFFIKCAKTGDEFAGRHILADFWDVDDMGNLPLIQKTIEDAAVMAGATILHSHYHPFGEGMGVSGVTVLSESHISIHTWPERAFASIDIFMCGDCNPEVALQHMIKMFKPGSVEDSLHRRGLVQGAVKAVAAIAA